MAGYAGPVAGEEADPVAARSSGAGRAPRPRPARSPARSALVLLSLRGGQPRERLRVALPPPRPSASPRSKPAEPPDDPRRPRRWAGRRASGGRLRDRAAGERARGSVGRSRRRGSVRPSRPLIGVSVGRDPDGRVLLAARANEPMRGVWTLPGGLVEAGEAPRRGRPVRELRARRSAPWRRCRAEPDADRDHPAGHGRPHPATTTSSTPMPPAGATSNRRRSGGPSPCAGRGVEEVAALQTNAGTDRHPARGVLPA